MSQSTIAKPSVHIYFNRFWLFIVSIIICLGCQNALAIKASEYEVKAAYLYHFTQFIDWPESAFESTDTGFNLCLYGGNPFGTALSPLLKRKYKTHPFTLVFPGGPENTRNCHILYLNNVNETEQVAVLEAIGENPVLVISSSPQFVENGGNIGFLSVEDHIRFAINRDAGEKRGLVSSAKLLELAVQIVSNNNGKNRP